MGKNEKRNVWGVEWRSRRGNEGKGKRGGKEG
jgi:hypothetical protein